jgi:hypothetical protein
MRIDKEQQREIVHAFLAIPSLRFPFETEVRKSERTSNDLTFAIPVGKKVFVWFTLWNNKETCFLLFRENNFIRDVRVIDAIATFEIYYGTVLYGTLFDSAVVAAEELMLYKGRQISPVKSSSLLGHCLSRELNPCAPHARFLTVGMPIILSTAKKHEVPYPVAYVQVRQGARLFRTSWSRWQSDAKKDTSAQSQFFVVRPDVQNDIYHLYSPIDDKYIGVAAIPDYNTSIFMNKIFRNIKENARLDALEESDTEDEFEDIRADKFICVSSASLPFYYHARFRKWAPQVGGVSRV